MIEFYLEDENPDRGPYGSRIGREDDNVFFFNFSELKGSITDSFDQASKIFDGMQDVGGELFGMVKDGALNVKNYLPFK